MKKRERPVEVGDLDAVAHFGEDLVLYIDNEDDNVPASYCVQANFDTGQFGPVQPMANYLDLHNYQVIQDADTQISYRQRILEEMKPDAIKAMLKEFARKQLLKVANLDVLSTDYQGWEPGERP